MCVKLCAHIPRSQVFTITQSTHDQGIGSLHYILTFRTLFDKIVEC